MERLLFSGEYKASSFSKSPNCGRRFRFRISSKQEFVATLYAHVENLDSPLNVDIFLTMESKAS